MVVMLIDTNIPNPDDPETPLEISFKASNAAVKSFLRNQQRTFTQRFYSFVRPEEVDELLDEIGVSLVLQQPTERLPIRTVNGVDEDMHWSTLQRDFENLQTFRDKSYSNRIELFT